MLTKYWQCLSNWCSRTKAYHRNQILGITVPVWEPMCSLCWLACHLNLSSLGWKWSLCSKCGTGGGFTSPRWDKETQHMSSLQTRDGCCHKQTAECKIVARMKGGPEGNRQHTRLPKASDRDCHSNFACFSCTKIFLISSTRKSKQNTCPCFYISLFLEKKRKLRSGEEKSIWNGQIQVFLNGLLKNPCESGGRFIKSSSWLLPTNLSGQTFE